MSQHDLQCSWLVGDLGATSCRLGLYQGATGQLSAVKIFRNDDFADLQMMLTQYISELPIGDLSCALAIAAPIDGDEVVMCNRNWTFSVAALAEQFGFSQIDVCNDFYAIGRCLPLLDGKDRVEIGSASAYRDGNIAVLGPGSGLGMSAWIKNASGGTVMSGEGGHITVAARDAREEESSDIFGNTLATVPQKGFYPALGCLHCITPCMAKDSLHPS